ncbi:MarR family winged helix-turn-helix transcriptional regulator [Kerstersia gyiorum]|uniref:MarR family winged helix-turn-helix transcriptional regulator n=1 Tax=Kerstersia gyiorum TaxID=206506 RepID=UPI0010708EAA|nr:MarR family winged helix-turn-helix transcriptional regulator [Kerstersia gyiorum]MCO7642490.1 MarR family winged helix-turn-helix transcriptional regulator [Pseudomonas sp. S 311-6]MCP1632835.1 DNA-binding MarR family transcriptional regulator [Kerstersia gyiorum]MCP1635634.1 DNA-binding MarR family transcriptional regulator [Kerstersia gyiorum]MCP1670959.1 DNA-binding MarR family transcriptional regulator [Kerstersia gyiorum]MCP1678386.1 DNA-binding MarR family transcriptional regulator [
MYAVNESISMERANVTGGERFLRHSSNGVMRSVMPAQTQDTDFLLGMTAALAMQMGVYGRAAQAAQAERAGLPQADFSALEYIVAFDGLAAGQLAQLMGISYGGAAAMADRLERTGYITRARHPLDRRVVLLMPVMARCSEVLKNRSRAVAELNRRLLDNYGEGAVRMMQSMLRDSMEALKQDAAQWLNIPDME